MPEITLEFIGKQLERLLAEMAGMRDDMLVLGARMDKTEAAVTVVSLEVRAFANQVTRMNDRLVRLEDAS